MHSIDHKVTYIFSMHEWNYVLQTLKISKVKIKTNSTSKLPRSQSAIDPLNPLIYSCTI